MLDDRKRYLVFQLGHELVVEDVVVGCVSDCAANDTDLVVLLAGGSSKAFRAESQMLFLELCVAADKSYSS